MIMCTYNEESKHSQSTLGLNAVVRAKNNSIDLFEFWISNNKCTTFESFEQNEVKHEMWFDRYDEPVLS